jgi:hypothetical protein
MPENNSRTHIKSNTVFVACRRIDRTEIFSEDERRKWKGTLGNICRLEYTIVLLFFLLLWGVKGKLKTSCVRWTCDWNRMQSWWSFVPFHQAHFWTGLRLSGHSFAGRNTDLMGLPILYCVVPIVWGLLDMAYDVSRFTILSCSIDWSSLQWRLFKWWRWYRARGLSDSSGSKKELNFLWLTTGLSRRRK